MAAPNLIGMTTVNGKTVGANLTSTSSITILNNPASSGKCLKINTLNVANMGNIVSNVGIYYNTGANLSGTTTMIASGINVPIGSTLNIIDKTSQYYLEENTSLGAIAGSGNILCVTISYEDIS